MALRGALAEHEQRSPMPCCMAEKRCGAMIEVVSCPANLAEWKPKEQPFYLELFGETSPLVDTKYAEVLPAGPTDGTPQNAQVAPIYEYWWTIGHPGQPHFEHHFLDVFDGRTDPNELWSHLHDEPAARVYVFFPINSGWRIKELVATVKYLTPVHEQADWWNKIANDWQKIAPIAGTAGTLAGMVPNPAFAGASSVLSTIAKLQINSVPQTGDLAWSVGKVTFGSQQGVMQGVMWELPKKMFAELGGRITGSIAISYIPSQIQQSDAVAAGDPIFHPQAILVHAVVYGPNGDIWAPGQREFIKLFVAPRAPMSATPTNN